MKLVFQTESLALYHGDCRIPLEDARSASCVIADPPYGQTSLSWDTWDASWLASMPGRSLWCFGSLRMFMGHARAFEGWKLSQDIVWEKHNGSSFHADRFRRVHETAAHFYKGDWRSIYRRKVVTPDATARTIRTKGRPVHMGDIERTPYRTIDGGPRLARSVIRVRSEHGRAMHPTQKPLGIIKPLIEYSSPPGGLVFDPFCGSGTTLIAAHALGRRAVGIEIDWQYCRIAKHRIERALQQENHAQ